MKHLDLIQEELNMAYESSLCRSSRSPEERLIELAFTLGKIQGLLIAAPEETYVTGSEDLPWNGTEVWDDQIVFGGKVIWKGQTKKLSQADIEEIVNNWNKRSRETSSLLEELGNNA